MPEKPRSELDATRLIDAELVRLARQGSISALRLIVRRHNQRLYRVARAIVRDNTEAEDVMQEAYLSAFGNLANFRAEANLSTWLTRIVVNKAIGHLRSERIMAPLEAVEDIERLEAGAAAMPNLASGFDPERAATRSQVRDLLERAIDNLPEPLRVVFMMRMVEQLSVRETAISLGIRQETVRTRLYRANKLMRERLQTTLAPRFTDTFPFEGPRCAEYTCALLTRLSERSQSQPVRPALIEDASGGIPFASMQTTRWEIPQVGRFPASCGGGGSAPSPLKPGDLRPASRHNGSLNVRREHGD